MYRQNKENNKLMEKKSRNRRTNKGNRMVTKLKRLKNKEIIIIVIVNKL
jgi:hypothetical protein